MEPLIALLPCAAVILIPAMWLIGVYNGFVRLRQHVRESWSGIDNELKRRYDLIPNLVATVKGYATHEKDVLESVIRARQTAVDSTGSPDQQARDENQLVSSMRRMFAVVENYPDLKASTNFLSLQQELANTEDRIAAARRFYNANVRDFNTRTETFPSNLIARMFAFERASYFEVEDIGIRAAPVINL